ncbi:NAD(P)-dependent oxidoreductase [Glycomyces salinus]|uniref:NAD(P)-dependent oxidoreductase n=1 Tax=Glycomyces salinus TaxID=980294 RepID=UPI0018EE12AC|nr:NAD(P)H-binding protein [Glycomyces salinus]
MRLVVYGAGGGTGRRLARQALDAGHDVAAVTRRPRKFPIEHPRLDVIGGDVRDPGAVAATVDGADAVLSTLGTTFSRKPITLYSTGITNIIAAMRLHGVTRVVAVTSSAAEPHRHADGGLLLNHVIQPLVTRTIGKSTYTDMRAMESRLVMSGLDWTVLRPSGLFDTDTVSDYSLREEVTDGIFTSRADLAACLLAQATDTAWIRKRVGVWTTVGTPSMWQMLRGSTQG